MPVLRDNNGLGDSSSSSEYTIRPDIVSGVPLVNPLWNANCPLTQTCQPYLNPAAFERPALGTLGDAPRTLDHGRGPLQNFLDISAQKNFPLRERLRLQVRVDLLNAFNHPVFGSPTGYGGSNDSFSGAPSTVALTTTAYNNWAVYNNQPQALAAGDAGTQILGNINAMINAQRLPSGALPTNFYTTPLPTGFALMNANSFNINTLSGYKLYQLRNSYDQAFGILSSKGASRYVQFGIKLYF
jgi:hypothetical protein